MSRCVKINFLKNKKHTLCCAIAEARSMNNNETIKKFKQNNKKMTQEI